MNISELLDKHAAAIRGKIHTTMPAKVLSYDPDNQTCVAQPLFKARDTEGLEVALPAISKIPVLFSAGGGFVITHPIEAGDHVLLIFAERSTEEWKAGVNSAHLPRHSRRFDVSDALAIPLQRPSEKMQSARSDALVVGLDDVDGLRIEISNANTIKIGTPTTDLLALLDALLSAIDTFTTATSAAVIEPTLAPASVTLKATAAAIKAQLSTIKGA